MPVGAGQVQAVCERAAAGLTGGLHPGTVTGSRADWARAAAAAQRVIDTATAVQDAAIARLAAIEPDYCEDGTEIESHKALGHVALDAPAILSAVLAVSAVHAQRRVATAVALAADGPPGTATETGLGALHTAMGAGRIDPYRAGVLADELEAAPAPVAACVVAALDAHFEVEDAAHLRRRCRRVLARISPDLLRQRAHRARAGCGLRRWADEPGVDHWEGTFPSEEAAHAWAAIDTLAQQYLSTGTCTGIERARGKALTDLVAGHATINTVLTLTVPATALTVPATALTAPGDTAGGDHRPHDVPTSRPPSTTGAHTTWSTGQVAASGVAAGCVTAGGDDLVEVTGPNGNQPVLVSRTWVTQLTTASGTGTGTGRTVQVAPCHPVTGALLNPDTRPGVGTRPDPGTRLNAGTRPDPGTRHDPHDDAARTATGPPDAAEPAGAYRPSTRLAQLVRARDRRCRFPGCTIAAVFCDLDHVRPWPAGPTTDTNLVCLCRRHHRIKQRPGWHATLTPDGRLTWTDPTGSTRTTHPTDALTCTILTGTVATEPTVLTATGATTTPAGTPDQGHPDSRPRTPSQSQTRTALPDGPHSTLEFLLEHHAAATPRARPLAATRWIDDHGHRHRTELTPATTTVLVDPHTPRPHRRRHRPDRRHHDHDPPPF